MLLKMKIFEQIHDLQSFLGNLDANSSIGFVPTMGALHEGHLALIKQAKKENQIVVCSIFVNKIQFNNEQDFLRYPRNTNLDIELLKEVNCDCLFMPTHEIIFPSNYQYKVYNLESIENDLEGLHRPGHFQGVCNVVDRLIDIVNPNILYLGQKDIQQCKVIEKMLTLIQVKKQIELKFCPTIRNDFGLALSSRNKRLSEEGLVKALVLIKALKLAQQLINENEIIADYHKISQICNEMILNEGFQSVDYFSILNNEFKCIDENSLNKKPYCIVTAATIEDVRLIDNIIL
jgi:pantoate--beta-alanine ligase